MANRSKWRRPLSVTGHGVDLPPRHRLATFAALASLLLATPLYAQTPPQAAVPVGVVAAEKAPVARSGDFVGRIEAIERVEVRARVSGYLDAVLFKEGDRVKEGDLLYRIEQAPFQATVQETQGAVLRAQAAYTNATLQAERAEELVKTSAVSVAERDKRVAEQKSAQGDVITSNANLRTAQINLGYTEIKSPITGIAGKTNVTKGNLVGPDSGVLTTIVSQDPMYVTFPVSQREILNVQRNQLESAAHKINVTIRFSDGSTYDKPGVINFLDVMVNRGTDAVTVRATIPNPDGVLIDGQLVRVMVQGGKHEEKVLVPQAALLADQEGAYVFVVQDGKAEIRHVKVSGERGPDAVVDAGLSGGEQVIVQGMEALRPGAAVTATPVLT
ncbi:MAG: efflux RND transporter periplasmic adaptor subunit, partial [Acetobacteraceae bacterium]|nr:efflux RND transporter periplasmic adaptor subunit [Acetobacteraceae bacterium]